MPIRLLIADDQRLFRQSLRFVLDHEPDISVVGEASDGQEAFEQSRALTPDVVLMDVEMPKLDGIAATRLLASAPGTHKVLMLSSYSDDDRVLHGIQAGAVGYILKDASSEEFVHIIRSTHAGENIASPYLANLSPVILARLRGRGIAAPQGAGADMRELNLTPREHGILDLLVQGKSNTDIADRLCVSLDTVKTHLQHIFRKIGVSSRLEAVIFILTGHRPQ